MAEAINIAIIGTGAVATSLAHALRQAPGVAVAQVYGRHADKAAMVAAVAGAEAISDLGQLRRHLDLYIIAVSDNAVADVAAQLPADLTGVVAHTAGSVPSTALAAPGRCYGVLYPMARFSPTAITDFKEASIFTCAADAESLALINCVASILNPTRQPVVADDQRRLQVHISAIWACNFVNHLLEQAYQSLKPLNQPLEVLRPLIIDTVRSALASPTGPQAVQTGPAMRGDSSTISKHLAALPPHQQELYKMLSTSIAAAFGHQL